jgi:hypothetical protein
VLLVVAGTAVLFGSWLVAWALPAPEQCLSIDCGKNFNPDQVTWHLLSFWNWAQLVVVAIGLAASVTFILIAWLHRPHTDTRSPDEV